ncbi:MAG: efflux RND transporter periplasmic adaptor subunit [Gemmatimonadetes bacterium]|nr:efflux RND transporter periplasmic adaptor subunit [Gemmatimonadota bacterium]
MNAIETRSSSPVLLLAAVLTAMGCGGTDVEGPEEAGEGAVVEITDRVELTPAALASLRLSYAQAEIMELAPSLEVPAELVPVPDRRASVGSRVSGRVLKVLVNTGDRVAAHQPLIHIESADVGRAWADLISARARESVARQARDRQEQLVGSGVTSVRSFEEAEGEFLIAEAEVRAALTRLATYGITGPGDPPLDPARITLRSPVQGTVARRSAHVGDWVDPTDVLIEVIDLDELWLEAAVYEREMRFVDLGQAVQVEVRALPGTVFIGEVERVEGVLDEDTRSVGVRIVLPNPEHLLRPGMFATASIQGTHAHEPSTLLAVPWAAVQEIDEHNAVFVRVAEGAFELRSVHTGERAGDFVEILTGLEPGDEVVTDGSFLLKGQLLRSTLAEEEG